MQDVPLISNLGSEFQLKPINFFPQLASLDIVESDDFEACMPQHGNGLFDYVWNGEGNNYAFSKTAFTLANPLPQAPPVATAVSAAG